MQQKEQPIEIGELIKQAKELNCSISLNFAQHVHHETVEADGVFIANFMPIECCSSSVKSIWGYWSEGYRLSGGTTLRLFKIEEPRSARKEEPEQISDCEFAQLEWYEEKYSDTLLAGCNGLSEEDFRPLKEDEDYTLELSDVDQQALDNVLVDLLDNHGVDGRSVMDEMIEHEKKIDLFDAYDRAKKDLEE